jgi:hypothetical protein
MKRVLYRQRGTHVRLRQTQQRRVLMSPLLLVLLLGLVGLLCLTQAIFSESLQASEGLTAPVAPFKGRPTRTPRPTPTSKPAPTPTATTPTVQTAVPTGTAQPSARSGGQAGPDGGAQAPDAPPGWLPWWGGGVLVGTLLIFGAFLWLFIRRTTRQESSPVFVSPAQRLKLHWRSTRRLWPWGARERGAPAPETDQGWELLPTQELPSPLPFTPPRWLIDAGLLKRETGDPPAANQQGRQGKGIAAGEETKGREKQT